MKRYQRRTIKSPCCNKKTHIKFQYGALMFGAFCDCGKPFYVKFRKVKSHITGFKGTRAGRLMMKTDSNTEICMPVRRKRNKKQKIIKKQKKKKTRRKK